MRKLKLKVEDLNVTSFAVNTSPGFGGTVQGQATPIPIYEPPSDGNCVPATEGTCIGPTYCCGATGPTNGMCVGPTFCCNPTANTGCCPGVTYTCPPTPNNPETCHDSCPYEYCGL